MKRIRSGGASRRGGQAMVEYVLALFVALAVAAAAAWLSGALRANGERTLDLVSSEYP